MARLGDDVAPIRNDDLAVGAGQRRPHMRAIVRAVKIEIGIGPQALDHLDVLAHARIALGIADPGAVAEEVEFLHPPTVDDVQRTASTADAVEARGHFRDHLRGHHAGMHGDHELNVLGDHGKRGSEHPGRKVGAEEALGDQRGVEAELVGAADGVARERERPVVTAREARA